MLLLRFKKSLFSQVHESRTHDKGSVASSDGQREKILYGVTVGRDCSITDGRDCRLLSEENAMSEEKVGYWRKKIALLRRACSVTVGRETAGYCRKRLHALLSEETAALLSEETAALLSEEKVAFVGRDCTLLMEVVDGRESSVL
ncbi:hypothetical protein AVEN_205682-1 [Araneus ventricosus]|uniref:Uncharacterized protein n=1 Tax=Araneus ventricosus TaxID=182803 RepID=A0A4Y2RHK8_ARAVE|nr:hypothetical protein AVEN_205682-1 [Araneus ventricosus]